MNGVQLEEVESFKNLDEILAKDGGCSSDVRFMITAATSAMAKLNNILDSSRVSFRTEFRLYKSLTVPVMLYGWEMWTLLVESERQIQAFEMKCSRRFP